MKKKRIIIGVSIMCIIVISITLILITNKSSSKVLNSNLENTTDNLDTKVPGMFAIMLETEVGTGKYEQSTSGLWPGSGYEFNSTLSQCENGGILTWNEENRTVNLKSNLSDRCYLYFDIVPPDVTINTNNNDNYNASTPASLSCTGATAEYNQKYQRIEISSIANKYTSCNLTYQTPSSKTYLNDYIIGLSGTTQGTGQVVNEGLTFSLDQSTLVNLTQSQYNNYTLYYSTATNASSGTDASDAITFNSQTNMWSTNPDNMEYGLVYTIRFTVSESGRYRVCANLHSKNNISRLHLGYKSGSWIQWSSDMSNLNDTVCLNIDYLDSGSLLYLAQGTGSEGTIDKVDFYVQKYSDNTPQINVGYRYEGKDPNNYIWFNNELWRIIGVFDENSHGVSGQNLVKIIRANSIGGLAWDKDNENDWTTSSLMNLLNGAYYNAENGTGGEYCYGYSTTIPSNCDYTEMGIDDIYRPMIKNTTWYLGGNGTNYISNSNTFATERNSSETTTGYIGLMYPSDYGYSVLASSCDRSTLLVYYNTDVCAGQSWLYGQGNEWTITPYSARSSYAFALANSGQVITPYAYYGDAVRPVLYLDSSVYVIDGNGSISDPYIIGM